MNRKRRLLVTSAAALLVFSFGTISVADAHERGKAKEGVQAKAGDKAGDKAKAGHGKHNSQFQRDVRDLKKAVKSGDQAKIDAAIEALKKSAAEEAVARKAKADAKAAEKTAEKKSDEKKADEKTTTTMAPVQGS